MHAIKISPEVQALLCCPKCRSKLEQSVQQLNCCNPQCGAYFPIVEGIPVLLNEEASIFKIDDLVTRRRMPTNPWRRRLKRLVPGVSLNVKGEGNYKKLAALLLGQSNAPRVLVVGGGSLGQGMQAFAENPSIDLVESDVSFSDRTGLICDAHDIPFKDEAFDGIIAQAVLEHVVDPYRCVEEIHRVLKLGGLIYAETPFMQQVHLGRYDFSRFTHLGQRRLFRNFEEIESGVGCGPGMALAWAYQYFLMSFSDSIFIRQMLMAFARFTAFYLKYFDYYLVNKAGALDAASGYYFLGRKANQLLSDDELIRLYRGANPSQECN